MYIIYDKYILWFININSIFYLIKNYKYYLMTVTLILITMIIVIKLITKINNYYN